MKKTFQVIMMVLALNFLALAGGVGWLHRSGHLSREQVEAIRQILFPPPAAPVPATQPAATTQPSVRLDELLARYAGKPPAEQLKYIRDSFDAQMAQLDRARRDLLAVETRVQQQSRQLELDRAALEAEKQKLADREKQAQAAANDKGFADSLALYEALPPKQVKTIFMGLDDKTVILYLQAMDPSKSAKVMKEFKAVPEEVERARKIIERMRQPQAGGKEQ